jgi:hypothetical protein
MKIDPNEPLKLTKEEAKALITESAPHGTDGSVFKANNKYLIKLYHQMVNKCLNDKKYESIVDDDSDVKIYEMKKTKHEKKPIDEFINYYVKEDTSSEPVKMRSSEAIGLAMNRQQKVLKTHLPKNAVYIDGVFAGCILLAQHGLQIHSLTGLPLRFKKKIMKRVLENVSELFDNCIYHVELFNKPHSKDSIYVREDGKMEQVGHSHVLVSPITLEPHIIDLEGKSTLYTSAPSEYYEQLSMQGVCMLMIEFLLGIDLDEYKEDNEDLVWILQQIGVKAEYIDKISKFELNIEEANDFIDSLDDIKRL